MSHTHIASDETLQRIADALEGRSSEFPTYDPETGRYDNTSISKWLKSVSNGLCYGVSVPKGSATACTKLGANAGIAAPTPGKIGTPAVDAYSGTGPFFFVEANGGVDEDGMPYVTAIQGDGRFRRDGSNGDVCTLCPLIYFREVDYDDHCEKWVSDSYHVGYELEGDAFVPDGRQRPYILRAKYALSVDADGKPRSVSGAKVRNRTLSHNTYVSLCATATSGLSGKTTHDDWYVKLMFLVKYATKNFQSVFSGCTSYSAQPQVTVAESGAKRVIVSKENAASLLVGSSMSLGTSKTAGADRNQAATYDVFDAERITRIEPYDECNSAVYFEEMGKTVTTEVGQLLSTAPWHTGACDSVEGDGSPTSPLSGKEPFVVQGIELSLGMYEIIGNAIFRYDGSGCRVHVLSDTINCSTSLTQNYKDTGLALPAEAAEGWKYTYYPSETRMGAMVGQGSGASTSTGMCDGSYMHSASTVGDREWLSLGSLGFGSSAGLWCVGADGGLSGAWWNVGGRLSFNGRTLG